MSGAGKALIGLALVPLLVIVGLLGFILIAGDDDDPQACGQVAAVDGNLTGTPVVAAGGRSYRGEQLANAAQIIRAGADAGVGARGQAIGVMVAAGESSLINVMHGDKVGRDSIGLFQQRDNGAWGTLADRTDPYTAATNFFRALRKVPGWETLEPTIAAHRVQGNADPTYYTQFWDDALGIIAAAGGGQVNLAAACNPDTSAVPVGAGGWIKPVDAPVTSGFGMRGGRPHNGLDFGAKLHSPVRAAAAGTVIGVCRNNRTPCTGYGTLVTVDHGGGVVTRYAHAYNDGVLVRVGDVVAAGQQLTWSGNYGDSTGPHLHFEVLVNGVPVDPKPWLTGHGVVL